MAQGKKLLSKRLPRDRQAHRGIGKPSGSKRPPRIKGPSVADAVIEDRLTQSQRIYN